MDIGYVRLTSFQVIVAAVVLLKSVIHIDPTGSLQDAIRRQIPLADEHLGREVTEVLFALTSQARIVEVDTIEFKLNKLLDYHSIYVADGEISQD